MVKQSFLIFYIALSIVGCSSTLQQKALLRINDCAVKEKKGLERSPLPDNQQVQIDRFPEGMPGNVVFLMMASKGFDTVALVVCDNLSNDDYSVGFARSLGATNILYGDESQGYKITETSAHKQNYRSYFYFAPTLNDEKKEINKSTTELIGLIVTPIDFKEKSSLRIRSGVKVRWVEEDSIAEQLGIFPDDIIISIDQKKINEAGDIIKYIVSKSSEISSIKSEVLKMAEKCNGDGCRANAIRIPIQDALREGKINLTIDIINNQGKRLAVNL
tara:strand:+ start:13140 stop:13961 length:822 start_codon:yes stop_codon:yes gene_type:complete